MIVGLGVDLCDVERVRRALEGPSGARFRDRVFTPAEQEYCEARRRGRYASYAARFAAKEAAMKALGTGWGGGVAWRDFEVLPAGDGAPPRLVLHGEAAKLAARRGLVRWLLALSHTDAGAVASVVVESGAPVRGAHAGVSRRRAAGAGSKPRRPRGRR